jgi:hypothetical protein
MTHDLYRWPGHMLDLDQMAAEMGAVNPGHDGTPAGPGVQAGTRRSHLATTLSLGDGTSAADRDATEDRPLVPSSALTPAAMHGEGAGASAPAPDPCGRVLTLLVGRHVVELEEAPGRGWVAHAPDFPATAQGETVFEALAHLADLMAPSSGPSLLSPAGGAVMPVAAHTRAGEGE